MRRATRGVLACALLAIALPGCAGDQPATAGTVDTEVAADSDTNADTAAETGLEPKDSGGIAMAFVVANFATSSGEYVDAELGYAFYGISAGEFVCTLTGTLPYEGAAAAGCPDCVWSFDLGPITGSTVTDGAYCESLGFTDGRMDGYFDYDWGFAPSFVRMYDDTPVYYENALFVATGAGDWSLFSFYYAANPDYHWTVGDAEYSSTLRPLVSSDGYKVFYPYDR